MRIQIVLMSFILGLSQWVSAEPYYERDDVREFAKTFAETHQKNYEDVMNILSIGKRQESILEAIARPAEKTLNWGEYRNIFVEPKRLSQGLKFWEEHRDLIDKISREYGVDPEMIVAIIGVETRYGRVAGSYRVIDALMTLGFDYEPRASFFRRQLEQFLLLLDEQGLKAEDLKGSYAGAMGYGQFIPGSYRAYAVDYDQDGVADIWNNPKDALASVANYFAKHKWRYGHLVTIQLLDEDIDASLASAKLKPSYKVADLRGKIKIPEQVDDEAPVTLMALETERGMEYWLGFENFYSITRYNHSKLYAMAAYQLSQLLKLHMDMP